MKILYVNVWSSQTTKKNNNLKEGTGNVDKRALEYWEKSTRKFIWVTYVQKFNIVRLKEYVFKNTGRIGGGGVSMNGDQQNYYMVMLVFKITDNKWLEVLRTVT